MNAEIAVIKILKDSAGVGALCADRIYPLEAPATTQFPYCIVELNGNEPFPTKDGTATVEHSSVNVFSYGKTYKEAYTLANAVKAALDGTAGTHQSVVVADIIYRGETAFSEEIENTKIYAKDQDYLVRIKL